MLSQFLKTENRVSRYMKGQCFITVRNDSCIDTWIDSRIVYQLFPRNLLPNYPKWIDSQFLRVRIDSALVSRSAEGAGNGCGGEEEDPLRDARLSDTSRNFASSALWFSPLDGAKRHFGRFLCKERWERDEAEMASLSTSGLCDQVQNFFPIFKHD